VPQPRFRQFPDGGAPFIDGRHGFTSPESRGDPYGGKRCLTGERTPLARQEGRPPRRWCRGGSRHPRNATHASPTSSTRCHRHGERTGIVRRKVRHVTESFREAGSRWPAAATTRSGADWPWIGADEHGEPDQNRIGRGLTRTNADNFTGNGTNWPRMTQMNADRSAWRQDSGQQSEAWRTRLYAEMPTRLLKCRCPIRVIRVIRGQWLPWSWQLSAFVRVSPRRR